jgi:hypothetical protein
MQQIEDQVMSRILRQSPCSNNKKSNKIETKDIDIQASNSILALGVGYCAIA